MAFVYKIHNLTGTDVTFALTNGGHNQGIISPPARKDRHYRLATTGATERRHDPDAWFARTHDNDGSWWPAWFEWLGARSSPFVALAALGRPDVDLAPLDPAPGAYVLN